MTKKTFSSNTEWENKFNYSRAVRVGNTIEVSGTTAVDEKGNIQGDSAATQAAFIFNKIEQALQQLDASLQDVVRTRMYIVDAADSDAVGSAHGKAFKGVNPAATMVVVKQLIDPQLLVEIEVSAIISKA